MTSISKLLKLLIQPHPQARLQLAWQFAQWGVFLLAFIPSIGGISVIFAMFIAYWQGRSLINQRWLNRGWLGLTMLLTLGSFMAVDRVSAWLGLFNLWPFFLMFAAFSYLIQTPAQIRHMARLFVWGSVPMLLIGYGQMWFGLTTPEQLQGILGTIVKPYGDPPGRMAATFMYANNFAVYTQVIFALAGGLALEAWQCKRPGWVFYGGMAGASLGALVLTSSRNSWAITGLICLALAIYQGWRLVLATAAVLISSALWSAFGLGPSRDWLRAIIPTFIWARLSDEIYPNRPLADLRQTQWQFASQLIQDRPLWGWGIRNFSGLYQAKFNFWIGHPHNLFLMLAAESGIPAMVIFAGLVGWVMYRVSLGLCQPKLSPDLQPDHLIIFTFLVAFSSCVLFNFLDVSILDLRNNLMGWLLFAGLGGMMYALQNPELTTDLRSFD